MEDKMNNKCVYLHKDKEGIVRYVGSGTRFRAETTCSNSGRGSKYTSFIEHNGILEVEIILQDLNKLEAENLERELFDKYKDTILNHRRPVSAVLLNRDMFEDHLYYDETSPSCLRWKNDRVAGKCAVKVKADSEAGSLSKSTGYYYVRLHGKAYAAHRIISVLHGAQIDGFLVDHVDSDRSNNRISNLRIVTEKENAQNRSLGKLASNNTSGVRGVKYHKLGYWVAEWSESGDRKTKRFPINNYLLPDESFKAAVEFRQKMAELYYN